ncbi:MAG: hypothetical protein VKK62_00770 [Synechococcaceae cyanobacterium]|nr:hypothetical protein [Synechococcaceae cyanobacterium]
MAVVAVSRRLRPLSLLAPAALALAWLGGLPARAHGGFGDVDLAPGQFRLSPVVTLEGHAGYENNLMGQPSHYAIDGLFGAVMEWGLPNRGSFAIEAMIGPALVWGEAEHFYGRVEIERPEPVDPYAAILKALVKAAAETQEGEAEAEEHAEEEGHEGEDHAGEPHGEEEAGHSGHSHHGSAGAPFRRTDIKAQIQLRYEPSERLSFMAEWKPYYVTATQGEDINGVKHELGVGVVWALGDGDVNFALGDGLETIADGLFLSLRNRTGWESDGTYIGNYTDPWVGIGFNWDRLNVTLSAGPRFYLPGSYSGLPARTDWGGELELALPVGRRTVLFAHWRPIYSTQGGEGWGLGWQHHIGTGVTFRF